MILERHEDKLHMCPTPSEQFGWWLMWHGCLRLGSWLFRTGDPR